MGKVSLEYGRDDWCDAMMLRARRVAAGYMFSGRSKLRPVYVFGRVGSVHDYHEAKHGR
jgi:hypothetical protein